MKNKNTKRIIKTVIMIIVCTFLGGLAGSFRRNVVGDDFVKYVVSDQGTLLFAVIVIFAIIQLGIVIYCGICRYRIKKDGYSNEENSVYSKIEERMGLIGGIGTTIGVVSVALVAVTLHLSFPTDLAHIWLVLWGFIVSANFVNEVLMVQLVARVQPDKDTDWSKFSLNRDMYNNLDECEKEKYGMIGAKLINSMHIIFVSILVITMLLTAFIEFSGMEFVIIGVIWGIFTLFTVVEGNKKPANKK